MNKKKTIFSLLFIVILIIGNGCKKEKNSYSKLEKELDIQHQKYLKEQEKKKSKGNKPEITKEAGDVQEKEDYVLVKRLDKNSLSLRESLSPYSIAFDSKEYFYILTNRVIKKYSSDEKYIIEWGEKEIFLWGYKIAIDTNDFVYLTDPPRNMICKFTSRGDLVKTWGKLGVGNEEFKEPCGIALDSKNNVYVTDRHNHRIQKFDSNGKFISTWGSYGKQKPSEFREPLAVAVDSEDFIYVADTWNYRIQKFDSEGNFIAMWGKYGKANGEFRGTIGIAIDSKNFVYVADLDNNRIQVFTSDGKYISKWGSQGDWNDVKRFGYLNDIAIDKKDFIYICDMQKYCIHVYKKGA